MWYHWECLDDAIDINFIDENLRFPLNIFPISQSIEGKRSMKYDNAVCEWYKWCWDIEVDNSKRNAFKRMNVFNFMIETNKSQYCLSFIFLRFSTVIAINFWSYTCVGSACCPEYRWENVVIGAPKGICGVSDVNTIWSQSIPTELDCPLTLIGSIWHLQGRRKAGLSSGHAIHPDALTKTTR